MTRSQNGGAVKPLATRINEILANVKETGYNYYVTKEPILIPGKGMYVGEYNLDENKVPIMEGYGMLYDKDGEFSYTGQWYKNKKYDGIFRFVYKVQDKDTKKDTYETGSAEFKNDKLVPYNPKSWLHRQFTYEYPDGTYYEGELIEKDGKFVPPQKPEVPRTLFNTAPQPTKFINTRGKKVNVARHIAERGFFMSDTGEKGDIVPPTPRNSPNEEPKFVRRSQGIKDRFSGIRKNRSRSKSRSPPKKSPTDKERERQDVRKIIELQNESKSLGKLERKQKLPPITRRGGEYRRHGNKKTMKTRE
jgi:hypothetical protein